MKLSGRKPRTSNMSWFTILLLRASILAGLEM